MNTLKIVLACMGAASVYVFVAGVVAHERRKVMQERRRKGPWDWSIFEFIDNELPFLVPALWPVMLPLIVVCVSAYTIAKDFLKLPYSAGYGLPEIGRRFSEWREKRKMKKAILKTMGPLATPGPICSCPTDAPPHVSLQNVANGAARDHFHDWLEVGSFRVCRVCQEKENAPAGVQYVKGDPP